MIVVEKSVLGRVEYRIFHFVLRLFFRFFYKFSMLLVER
jgi:hypothetical protein